MTAQAENAARGFAEGMARFDHRRATLAEEEACEDGDGQRMPRAFLTDSPVQALARRRDKEGEPFLSPDLVRASERLREDFELAQSGSQVAQNWDRFMTAGTSGGERAGSPLLRGPAGARKRVDTALCELGPGLGDVALRCCCHLEGLESVERKMGWSARSGKIVLRIALQRLAQHYARLSPEHEMIG